MLTVFESNSILRFVMVKYAVEHDGDLGLAKSDVEIAVRKMGGAMPDVYKILAKGFGICVDCGEPYHKQIS
ncbi:MAG: hypothetical protein ACOX41_03155 [Anaerovoracaceae bacterium]